MARVHPPGLLNLSRPMFSGEEQPAHVILVNAAHRHMPCIGHQTSEAFVAPAVASFRFRILGWLPTIRHGAAQLSIIDGLQTPPGSAPATLRVIRASASPVDAEEAS
jgi:hypothetical protein